jgi:hypothetical protein
VGRRGAAAAPLLSNLLRDPDETVVAAAAMSAGRLGEAGEACLPALFDALRRFPDQPSVIQTVRALPGKLEPFLVRWLEGSDLAEQKQAARLVLYTGAQNPGTLGPLMRILERDGPDDLKELAIGAIGTIGVPADPAIPLLESYVARGGELGTYAARTIKMIASAHKIQEIREEEAAEAEQKKREAAGGN